MKALFGLILLAVTAVHAEPVVSGVTAKQRYPWNGKVDIVVTIRGDVSQIDDYECAFVATNCVTQVAVSVTAISQIGVDAVSGDVCTRRYLWNATNDVGAVRIDDLALIVGVRKQVGGVQLWENGPYWAECNVGAKKPEECGYYFWWGDTVGYKRNASNDGWVSVSDDSSFSFDPSSCPTRKKDKLTLQAQGYIDSTGNLVAAHDAATAHLGAPWRMPTDAEMSALVCNCDTTWTMRNGVYGRLVTGKGGFASESIFFPAAEFGVESEYLYYDAGWSGYYWSSTPDFSGSSKDAWCLDFTSEDFRRYDYSRYFGHTVRPLREFVKCTSAVTGVVVTTHLKFDSRTDTRVLSSDNAILPYEVDWYENGDSVRIVENDTVVATGSSGVCVWHPESNSSSLQHVLKLEVLSKGEVIATETAQFALGYVRNVTARQLWPHKKVEVCYDIAEDIGAVADMDTAVTLACSGGYKAQKVLGDASCRVGRHRVVWDLEADDIIFNCTNVTFTVSVAADGKDLVHRWMLNGSLSDSVGGQTASAVGSVTTDGRQYRLVGGERGMSYISLGSDILPTDTGVATVEIWATRIRPQHWSRVFDIGNGSKKYLMWAWRNETEYENDSASLTDAISYNDQGNLSVGDTEDGVEYLHVMEILNTSGSGDAIVTCKKYRTDSGVLCGTNVINMSSYQLGTMAQDNCWLGHSQFSGDYDASASYNEVRVWSSKLSDFEIRRHLAAGPDQQFANGASLQGVTSNVVVITSSDICDGMSFGPILELGYSVIDAESVSIEVNGTVIHTASEHGTFDWMPAKPGTYILSHRAGEHVFTRKVVCTNAADMSQLEIGWLDQPVSNLFPNIYASVTNITIAPTMTKIPENAFAGCACLNVESGVVIRDGCVLFVNGDCPTDVILPKGVRIIADGAFRNCSTLVSISIPEGCKAIGVDAFANCTDLEELVIPEGVEEIGDRAFLNCTYVQAVEFPSTLKKMGNFAFANCTMLEGIECFDGLKTIGDCAFSNCWRMQSVALPASVDEIGTEAFHHCINILGVTIPAHVDTVAHLFPDVYQTIQAVAIAEGEAELTASVFSGCALLEEVQLSDAIREIPDSTFEGCSELRRIRFPESLVRIGNRAFYGCGQVWQLEFPEGLKEIGDDAFNGLQQVRDLVCPSSVRKIGARAFRGVWNDEEVKLPEGLESLGVDAFANCSAIRKISLPAVTTPIKSAFPNAYTQINSVKILGAPTEIPQSFCQDVVQLSGIKIPDSVTNICNYAFAGLSNLAAIELPPNLLAIGAYAFSDDSHLVTIDLPERLTTVGEYAFNGNGNLVTVSIPQSVTSVGYRAFWGCGNVRIVSCSGELATMSTLFPSAYGQITTVSINAGTTRLMDDLLSGCSKLTEIDLPSGITSIGARAFLNCSALTAFGVPQGVISIGNDVFNGCVSLTSLSLPEGLTSIPSGAFRNCRAISEIVIPASVTYLGADAFNGCSALKLISYLGAAPEYDSGCYYGTPSDLVSHVIKGSRGWDGLSTSKTLPENWPTTNSRTIDYWTPNTFVVTFDGNGGSPASTSVVQTTGMTYILPEDVPAMTGARFNGWWTERVNGGRIKSITKVEVTRAQTFYAHWKYNTYTVRFDANGGFGEMDDVEMTVNTSGELPTNVFLRKGCRFAGWSTSSDGEVEFEDGAEVGNLALEQDAVVTLYAVWTESAWGAAEYLNVSGHSFALGGDVGWTADDEVSHDGVGSMRSGAIAAAQEEGDHTTSVLLTTVVGAGTGSFWWKVDCEPSDEGDYYDYCSFSIDGVVVTNIAGQVDWEKIDYEVAGEGEHVLSWTFARDDYDEDETLYENSAWVDELVWSPTPVTLSFAAGGAEGDVPAALTKHAGYSYVLPGAAALSKKGYVFVGWSDGENVHSAGEVYAFGSSDAVLTAVWEEKVWTLSEAANVTNAILSTGGAAEWVVDLATNYDGAASIRSGVIGDSEETWVEMGVTGAGTIAFRALVSGEYNRGKLCDYLKFEIDGTVEFSSYDAGWSNVVVSVTGAEAHVLKWTYLKNASKSAGYDCAWIDEIVWTAAASVDPIPDLGENPTAEAITNVLYKAEDPKLAEKITNETAYAAFREWSGKVKQEKGGETAVGAAGVMAAPHAWLSYALGSETLLEKKPEDGDLTVETFAPQGEKGKFDFTVRVKDVDVGGAATTEAQMERVKENLKQVFGLEGGTSLEAGGMSSANVDITFDTPEDGKVKFTAGPKDTDAKTFFMKVKVK